jgi:hypothetical protein
MLEALTCFTIGRCYTWTHEKHHMKSSPPTNGIKNAIAAWIKEANEDTLPPLIGGFTLFAEYTEPSGEQRVIQIRDEDLSIWAEQGILSLRISEIEGFWQAVTFPRIMMLDPEEDE